MKSVTIITDGSCLDNGKSSAYGGWAAILTYGTHKKELYGTSKSTTNNRMELTAVIKGVEALTMPCEILVVSDSTYVGTILEKINQFAKNDWHYPCGFGTPKNVDLYQDLFQVLAKGKHKIKFQHIKGHSGDKNNERANALAQSSARALKAMEEANA